MLSGALLVCRVEYTKWPVSDPWIATLAVSSSRISPNMMMSGSARKNVRIAAAKFQPIFGFICTWRRPAWVISIGSSAVQILRPGRLTWCSTECSVVVLPDPVGPHTRNMPCGRAVIWIRLARLAGLRLSRSSGIGLPAANTRNTTSSSPLAVGIVATRSSTLAGLNF